MGTWERIERRPGVLDYDDTPECPRCGAPTDSLKQYRCLYWCLYLLAGAVWQTEYVRACPGCMRSHLVRRALLNIPLAHLLWPFLVLPWTLILFACTYRAGHSPAVLSGFTPGQAAAREAAERELSWGRVFAVVALLFCWVPLFGPPVALLAWLLNRRSTSWTRRASIIAGVISAVIHLLLIGLIVVESANG